MQLNSGVKIVRPLVCSSWCVECMINMVIKCKKTRYRTKTSLAIGKRRSMFTAKMLTESIMLELGYPLPNK